MNEQPLVSNSVYIASETSILENPYEKEVQDDIWRYERKKTMMALFAIGMVLLVSNVIGYSSANALDMSNLPDIILFPVLFFALALFARLQPMVSAISGIAVIIVITVINYFALGPSSLIMGWLYKSIALYFIVASVRHAKDAEAAKKKLQELS